VCAEAKEGVKADGLGDGAVVGACRQDGPHRDGLDSALRCSRGIRASNS